MTAAFTELGLCKALTDNLERINISEPTPVQAEAIPVVASGRDLIATAPTGTGKTGAFLLPVIERLIANPKPGRGPRVLVLSPTRELAAQIGKAAKGFTEGIQRVKTVTITGGESYQQQNRVLERPYEILIATPGRLIDQMSSDRIDLSRVEVLILDEADRMLDIGFTDAVLEIASKIPEQHQTLCFTATMSHDVIRLSQKLLKDPHRLEVGGGSHTRANITQRVIYVDNMDHKHLLLRHWVTHDTAGQVIVFTATKRDADEIAEGLIADGISAIALHGDLTQRARTRALGQLRSGEARVLVATDVAARGIDVSGISHVINFDLPKFAEDYVHRIGRTGRAGLEGMAVSFVGRQDIGALKRIERFVSSSIEEMKIEGLESRFRPEQRGSGGRDGGRFNDRKGGGQRRDQQPRREGGGFRGGRSDNRGENRGESRGEHRGEARADSRGENRGNTGNAGDSRGNSDRGNSDRGNSDRGDRQPRFGGQEGQQPRPWRKEGQDSRPQADRPRPQGDRPRPQGGDRPRPQGDRPRPQGGERAARQDRAPRDDNFGNRGPRDDNFGNRAPREDRQPRFADDDRQPNFGGGNAEPAPHYYDERQPDFNENRPPAFDAAARRGRGQGVRSGAPRSSNAAGGGADRDNRDRGNGGNRPPRAAKPGGKPAGKGAPRKPRDGQRAGPGARTGNGPQRGRRPKQVGLYMPDAPAAARPDWRNERLSDTPKKPKIIKKGDVRAEKKDDGGNNTWSFTGKTLRLKRKGEGDE